MTLYFFILLFITLVNSEGLENSTACNGFQANFTLKDAIGDWHVVAIIPENLFPDKQVTCYKVEISETDEASLRWLINKTVSSPKKHLPHDVKSTIVRQRYHTETPFDVWSKAIHGVNGCFRQVISLDIKKNDIRNDTEDFLPSNRACARSSLHHRQRIEASHCSTRHKTLKHDAIMQLHLLEVEGSKPFLLQMLWGRMIAVVIYRRNQGATQEELKPVFEFMTKLRGPQRLPKICDSPLKHLLVY